MNQIRFKQIIMDPSDSTFIGLDDVGQVWYQKPLKLMSETKYLWMKLDMNIHPDQLRK